MNAISSLGKGASGVFGVELFLLEDGSVLLNEVAPRPHNTGHYTQVRKRRKILRIFIPRTLERRAEVLRHPDVNACVSGTLKICVSYFSLHDAT